MFGHMSRSHLVVLLVTVLIVVALSPSASQASGTYDNTQRIAIPSYFYPAGAGLDLWDQMEAAYPTVGLAVANPGVYTLPDPRTDPNIPPVRETWDDVNYRIQVAESQAVGIKVLGYTHTQYGARDAFLVKSDIDILYDRFNVDGIFLDEVSTDCDLVSGAGDNSYYKDLFDYIKAKTQSNGDPVRDTVVVLNPGTATAECYMEVGDIVVTFEGYFNDPGPGVPAPGQWYWDNFLAPDWVSDYPANRFWHLIHTTGTVEEMLHAIRLSKDRNVGWIYVTPDVMDNPWDTLPPAGGADSYWAQELAAVQPGGPTIYSCAAQPEGMAAWWRAEANAADSTGANHGTIHMETAYFPPFTVGKVGKSFSLGFGGYHDYVAFGAGPSITGEGPFSIEAWVATTFAPTDGVIIQQRDGRDLQPGGPPGLGYEGQYMLRLGYQGTPPNDTAGHVCFMTYGDSGQTPWYDGFGFNFCSNGQVNDGVFHHIVAVRAADGTGYIYIDGVLDANHEKLAPSIALQPLDVFIGGDLRDFASYYRGLVDEVTIYDRALTGVEVQALYDGQGAGKCTNVPPTLGVDQATIIGSEGHAVVNSGTVADADGDTVTLSSSTGAIANNGDGTWSWTFTPVDDIQEGQTVLITGDDGHGGVATTSFVLTVSNLPPVIETLAGPVDPTNIGDQPVHVSVEFSDPGSADVHNVSWEWGDETTDTQSGVSSPASQAHVYNEAGVYSVQVTVADDDGGTDVALYVFIVIYDPEGGFVTGGGWINSPAGAYIADPALTGKATFGFVSKYKKGAETPTGQTQFQFKVADLNFHSESYAWLVVAGHKAIYKGTGTINGSGNYGFLLSAIDEALTPSTTVDLFRIKIWDKENGDAIVYDNQAQCAGTGDDADPCTAIAGGNIVIHKASSSAKGSQSSDTAADDTTVILLPIIMH